jgi:iron complex transport system substrate-binding protein
VLIISLASCKKDEPQEPSIWPVQVGQTVIQSPPKRVISLSPALTEQLFILGYGGRLVGISSRCEPPKAAGKLEVCGTSLMPDTDKMVSLSPDLVVASSSFPQR